MSLVHEKQFPCYNLHIPPLGTNVIIMPFFMSYLFFDLYFGRECNITACEGGFYVRGNFKFGLVFSNNPAILTWFI